MPNVTENAAEACSTDKQLPAIEELLARYSLGEPLSEIAGLTKDHIQSLYAVANKAYSDNNYETASALFTVLCLFEPLSYKNYFGLASCQKEQGLYADAITNYKKAAAVAPRFNSYAPLFYASVCLLKLGNKDDALKILETLHYIAEKDKQTENSIVVKAQAVLNILTFTQPKK